jgi:hypothetical protein
MVGSSGQTPLADGGHSAGSAHGEVGRLVDKAPDLDEVKEDGRINGPRPRGVVVGIRNGLEDLGGQLEPWAMERRYVSPMPAGQVSVAAWREDALDREVRRKRSGMVQYKARCAHSQWQTDVMRAAWERSALIPTDYKDLRLLRGSLCL